MIIRVSQAVFVNNVLVVPGNYIKKTFHYSHISVFGSQSANDDKDETCTQKGIPCRNVQTIIVVTQRSESGDITSSLLLTISEFVAVWALFKFFQVVCHLSLGMSEVWK